MSRDVDGETAVALTRDAHSRPTGCCPLDHIRPAIVATVRRLRTTSRSPWLTSSSEGSSCEDRSAMRSARTRRAEHRRRFRALGHRPPQRIAGDRGVEHERTSCSPGRSDSADDCRSTRTGVALSRLRFHDGGQLENTRPGQRGFRLRLPALTVRAPVDVAILQGEQVGPQAIFTLPCPSSPPHVRSGARWLLLSQAPERPCKRVGRETLPAKRPFTSLEEGTHGRFAS